MAQGLTKAAVQELMSITEKKTKFCFPIFVIISLTCSHIEVLSADIWSQEKSFILQIYSLPLTHTHQANLHFGANREFLNIPEHMVHCLVQSIVVCADKCYSYKRTKSVLIILPCGATESAKLVFEITPLRDQKPNKWLQRPVELLVVETANFGTTFLLWCKGSICLNFKNIYKHERERSAQNFP